MDARIKSAHDAENVARAIASSIQISNSPAFAVRFRGRTWVIARVV
jgi:hypothetical protein